MGSGKTAVLLLQMGGPEDVAAIRPFLYNLFTDPGIVPLPGPAPLRSALAGLISTLRARKVAARYRAIGGGSPLGRITGEQARALEAWLGGLGLDVPVRTVMRYTPPRAIEVVAQLRRAGVTRLLALSLYPHYSRATTGSSLADIAQILAAPGGPTLESIDRWGDAPGYHDLLARWIGGEVEALSLDAAKQSRQPQEEMSGKSGAAKQSRQPQEETGGEGGDGAGVRVLFSAHGLPEKVILAGDPYRDEVERTFAAVAARLPGVECLLSFQSRIGPVKWIGPATGDVIERLAAAGVKGLVLVPLGFVSDHIETLYDMDIVYRNLARARGMECRRLRAFNADPEFIALLGGLVRDCLGR